MPRAIKGWAIVLFFFGMSLVYTAPLYQVLGRALPYTSQPADGNEVIPFTEGDPPQLYYHFWMAWDYFRGGPGPFFRDPYEFSDGEERIFTTRRLWISLIYLLLCPLGTVFAYNALILLCITLSGLTAYLLARHYTGRDGPALVAGTIFAFFPFALGQILGGHTNGFLLFLIPWALYCIEKGFSTGKSVWFFLTLVSFSGFAFIEYHLLYYIFLLAPPFFLLRAAMVRPGWKPFFRHAAMLAASAAVAMTIMMTIKHFEISGSVQETGRSLHEVLLYSPHWRDFFQRLNPNMEKNIYLGYGALAAAAIGFLFSGWRRPLFWIYAGIFAAFGLLTLGISSEKLSYPYRMLYEYLPYFSLSRLPGRMVVFVMLALAILAALALARFRRSGVLSLVFLLGVGAEYFPRSPAGVMLLPKESKVYWYVAENIGEKKLLCLPIWPGDTSWSSIYLYYLTLNPVPILNGYYPIVPKDYLERVFYPLYSMNVGELRPEQVERLRQFNVKYILFHEEAFPGKVSHFPARVTTKNLMGNPHLRFVLREGPQWLFELLPQARPGQPQFVSSPIGIYLSGKKLKGTETLLVDHRLQVLPPGEYQVQTRVPLKEGEKIGLRILGVEPMKRKEGKYLPPERLATKELKKGDTALSFKIKTAQLVTLQIDRPAGFSPTLDWILITKKKGSENLWKFEAETLFIRGEIIEEEGASGGKAVCARPEKVAQTEMLYGPYLAYPPGKYILRVYLKPLANASKQTTYDEDVAKIDVATEYGKEVLATRSVSTQDLFAAPHFHPISLSFSLDREQVLEFRVLFLRRAGICVDRLEVVKEK